MSDDQTPPEPDQTPGVRSIRQLVRLMRRFDLTAIDLVEGETTIRLRRRTGEVAGAGPAAAAAISAPATASAPAAASAPAQAPSPAEPAPPETLVIESPMVGTFYASGAPDAPPLVTVGTVVRPDTIVCIIEAMKVFTEIPAGVSGTITEILVRNGQPVEFGQPLFRVAPA